MARREAALAPKNIDGLTHGESLRKLHELRVHQIELEMQNEELLRTHVELDAARARYFDFYDLAPVGFFTVSEQGLILEANLTAASRLGVARDALVQQRLTSFIFPQDEDIYYLHCKQLFETGEVEGCDLRMLEVDGTTFWARLESTAARAEGKPVCRVVMTDITRRKRAETDLRATNTQLAAIYANAPLILLVIDEQLRVREANHLASRFAGREAWVPDVPAGEALGCMNALADARGCGHGLSCGQCPLWQAISGALTGGGNREGFETWLPLWADGESEQRCLLVSTTAMKFNGSTRVLVCAQDITTRKRAEEEQRQSVCRMESAVQQQAILLKEIHHRVKNNLAVTASLLSMKGDGCGPEAKLALEESQQRIHSIALVHEYLYTNDSVDRIDFGEYARDLVQGVYSAFGGEEKRIGLDLQLDAIELGIERAVPCALILNELLSNALKYAFADGRTGRILVSFRQSEQGSCELAVEDDGVGLRKGALLGQNKSLGLRIVRILTTQLDGSVEQQTCLGTRIVLRFPAAG
jgi:PAS domain S-box-containing protein